jgi:hypothetical protein
MIKKREKMNNSAMSTSSKGAAGGQPVDGQQFIT